MTLSSKAHRPRVREEFRRVDPSFHSMPLSRMSAKINSVKEMALR